MSRTARAVILVVIIVVIGGIAAATRGSNNNSSGNNTGSSTGASSQNNTGSSANSASASEKNVNITNMLFSPSQVTIPVGTTVTWTNNDSVAHTVTSDDGTSFSSGNINPGETFSHTFNTVGSFQYHCAIHSSMHGTVVVRS